MGEIRSVGTNWILLIILFGVSKVVVIVNWAGWEKGEGVMQEDMVC